MSTFNSLSIKSLKKYRPLLWGLLIQISILGQYHANAQDPKINQEFLTFLAKNTFTAEPEEIKLKVAPFLRDVLKLNQEIEIVEGSFSTKTKGRFQALSSSFIQRLNLFNEESAKALIKPLLHSSDFKRIVLSLSIAYQLISVNSDWLLEQELYMFGVMNLSFFESESYVNLRYGESLKHLLSSVEFDSRGPYATYIDQSEVMRAIDFWIKREVDGSRAALSPWIMIWLRLCFPHLDLFTLAETKLSPFKPLLSEDELSVIYQRIVARPQALYESNFWRSVSGLKLERPLDPEERVRPFTHLNPRLVIWVIDHLLPSPMTRYQGQALQEIYQEHLSSIVHALYGARELLYRHKDLQAEKLELALAMLSPDFDQRAYLLRRYGEAPLSVNVTMDPPQLSHQNNLNQALISPHQAILFWLQREIDGTAPLIWGGLRRLILQFDPLLLRRSGFAVEVPQ